MGIGAGIFLIAVGAILAFAVHTTVSGLDVQTIGVILMIAGAAGIALDLAIFAPRRRRVVTSVHHDAYAPVVTAATTVDPVTGAPVRRTTTTRDIY